jgi:hypothetical protein
MTAGDKYGADAGLRERLVGGVSLYVERPAALPGAGDAARIENLIAELEEKNAASAEAARAGYAQLRALLVDPPPAEGRATPARGRLARFLSRTA